ncbi:hypothetical protein M9Y10_040294 [Tritrichomonas musculus]|uniref:Adenylate and Guanylate cyclase catalytic domain containing protein n=1 Tax=Tritrichomonas musculus TaxID=1915356 RepID=A0ABR2GPP9_9EUKA
MINPVESSVISKSQSDVNIDKGKMQLVLGTTTKLDSIFQILDQICLKTRIPQFFYILMAIYLYYQVIFCSLYPFNKYWIHVHNDTSQFPSNTKIVEVLNNMEKFALFAEIENGKTETNLFSSIIVLLAFLVISVLIIIIEFFGASHYHKTMKLVFHIFRFMLDIISPIMVIPASAVIGLSIRNLILNGNKLNWVYLFVGLILLVIYLLYSYISLMLLNQSTCLIVTPFSSFNIKLSLFFVSVCSLFLLFQCIFSLFHYWAMVIVQLSHLVVSIISFYPMCYLQFHSKYANIFFNGITLSTWVNDVIFAILYFIPPVSAKSGNVDSNKLHFYYMCGLVTPAISLIGSLLVAYIYVKIRMATILKELKRLSDMDTDPVNVQSTMTNVDIQESDSMMMLANHKLFKNENLTLMSIHLSFTNCLPLFYKLTAIKYAVNRFPTIQVLLVIVQYLSFFPGSSRKLNNYLKFISQNRDLKYHQRFLLFQIFRIKTMRQSSVSPEANRRFAELKTQSNQLFEDIVSFWDLKEINVPYLEMISKENRKIESIWEDSIRDFPNLQKFSDEYCSYLLECKMNVPKAIVMKHRSSLIEMGRNFTVDYPFICLAKSFPSYLKKGIVDSQGSFRPIVSENANNNSASHTFSNTHSSNSSGSKGNSTGDGSSSFSASSKLSDFDLDPEFEETIGKQLFKEAPLRIELHRSLEHKKSYASRLMLFNSFIVTIIGIGLLIGLFLYLNSYIQNRTFSLVYLNVVSNIRYYIDLSILGTTLKFSYDSNRFKTIDFFNSLDAKDNELGSNTKDVFFIDDQLSFSMIHLNSMISRELFNVFIAGLAELSSMGGNAYALTADMMLNIVPFYTCYEGVPSGKFNMSLKALQPYLYLMLDRTAGKKVEDGNWFNSDEICEIIANQQAVETSTMNIFMSLLGYELVLSERENRIIDMFSIVFTIIPAIVYLVPVSIYMKLFLNDIKKLIKILFDVNPKYKEEAKKPIRKDTTYEQSQTSSDKKPKSNRFIIPLVLMIIFCIVNSLLIYFMLSETDVLNENIKRLGRWHLCSAIRLASAVESLNYMLIAVILNDTASFNISNSTRVLITRPKMIAYCRYSLDLLEKSNEDLLQGTVQSPPCKGFDNIIDQINYQPVCDVVNNNTNMHDSYRCVSTSQGVSILVSLITSIIDDIETHNDGIDEKIAHTIHLLNRHLLDSLIYSTSRFNDAHLERSTELQQKALIILCVGIVLNIFIFMILLFFYNNSNNTYSIGMMLTQRLPPAVFLTNKKLLNFILNKKEKKGENEMSTSQSVIYMSLDAIICTNGSGVVEIINPAVTNILGYTPDQMLGQNISVIFASLNRNSNETQENEENKENTFDDAERITNQLELMKNGQSALVFEDHFTCLTDNNLEMPCGVTILGMTSSGHINDNSNGVINSVGNVESFVFIICDETQLMEQQREAEKAKAQSENLLFQILPRNIVTRLNSGEKDISFTVPSASVIFTDVVRFSEYASSLSPQQIMGSLSTLFAAFDTCAKNYELLTKIKLIGDIYMAATGLFADDKVTPKDHAEQILKFGLECLNELDTVNIKLNANLQLRIGINSGGPILAGVLGTDKPVFDIIGDPINVAARLQTTDIPGKIQIPKSTYDLICDLDFSIEERGEVFLKGKGKTIAYLVSPSMPNSIIPLESASSQQLL